MKAKENNIVQERKRTTDPEPGQRILRRIPQET